MLVLTPTSVWILLPESASWSSMVNALVRGVTKDGAAPDMSSEMQIPMNRREDQI